MIFRLSHKLAKKIKTTPRRAFPLDSNAFVDWSAHLFTAERAQYIILTNTASLYSTVMYGRGISSTSHFLDQGLSCIREFMIDDSQEFIYRRFVAPSAKAADFSKALNRSTTGSMNDLVYHAQMWLTEGGLSPHDTSFKLNEIPMSAIDYANSREALKSLGLERNVPD